MPTQQSLRKEAEAEAASDAAPPPASADTLPEGFRPAGAEDRLPVLLAYGLAAAAGSPRPEEAPARRAEAERALEEWAFRHLHNQAEVLRREGAREAIAGLRQPPGFGKLVLAGLVSLLLAALIAWGALRLGLLPYLHLQLPG
ncbi:hypothetical protein E0493_01095 [Roseomonas sp. M0104]|uniref:Uncharacterized protein n=1 Tax=Teichococcus coralli TaxID=2545983 RepID=A0A845B5M8_9PROT|nr:hypothetical protein [Pseudoroseomonas coralli]MXP61945.1 hypothetical protein [Pseudoroseomonas coralli]